MENNFVTESAQGSALVRYGVSDELIGMFDSLRETPGLAGRKFRLEAVNSVAQGLICRNYGKACLELSYLLFAVVNLPRQSYRHSPLLDFFWLQEAFSVPRFRQAFRQLDGCPYLTLDNEVLRIQLPDGQFAISPTRVGFLAVLFEFIVNVQPDVVLQAERDFADGQFAAIKGYSSSLQKLLYQYLNQHLAPAQQQRRLRFILQYIQGQVTAAADPPNPANPLRPSPAVDLPGLVDDDLVLAFWQRMAITADDNLGFRRYRTVVENFLDFLQAYHIGVNQQAVQYAAAIGEDSDAGEISPQLLDTLLGAANGAGFDPLASQVDEPLAIAWLAENPKFISKQQLSWLQVIVSAGQYSQQLPLSVVRMQVFGEWQAQLLQAVRSGKAANIQQKLQRSPESLYPLYWQQAAAMLQALTATRYSILFVLTELKHPALLDCLGSLLSDPDWQLLEQQLMAMVGEVAHDPDVDIASEVAGQLGQSLSALCLQCPPLNQLMQQAKTAYKSNHREGFKVLPSLEQGDVYAQANEFLRRCSERVNQLIKNNRALFLPQAQLLAKTAADLAIFQDIFVKMVEVTDE